MLTADTITDEQIRELGAELELRCHYSAAMWCDYALVFETAKFFIPHGCERMAARARCAEMLNAREKAERNSQMCTCGHRRDSHMDAVASCHGCQNSCLSFTRTE